MAKKKVNPRRIPLAKREINKDAILQETMHGKMDDAWILVANALNESGYTNLSELNESVGDYIDRTSGKKDISHAEELMGIKTSVRMDLSKVNSPVELESFKKKLNWTAIRTALGVICLGLDATGQFTEDELKKLFLNVDLSLAEVESGLTSYDAIERDLLNRMVKDEMEKGTETQSEQSVQNRYIK